MKETGKKLSELKRCMSKFPQVLVNIKVRAKPALKTLKSVQDIIKQSKKELGSDSRILVRYSGTENKCRVMVEGKDPVLTKKCSGRIADAIKKEIGE